MERRRRTEGNNFWNRHFSVDKAGKNLSWGSVFAGALTFVATFFVLTLITSALGFGFVTPTSSNPFQGVGTSTGISLVITLAISLFAGGFVSGLAARRTGILHGFLTWALAVVLMFTFVTSAITSLANTALNVTTSVVGTTANVVGTTAQGLGTVAGDGINLLLDEAANQIGDVNVNQLQNDTEQILRDTNIEELQPEYLNSLAVEARNDITAAGRELLLNPEDYDRILNDLSASLQEKADRVSAAADRDAITNAVQQNTDLSEQEADEAVDNIMQALNNASSQVQTQFTNAQNRIEQTRVQAERTIMDARIAAEDASNTISQGFMIAFVGLLIGLALSVFGGILGAQKVKRTVMEE